MTIAPPIVIDLGRVRGRDIEMLRQGRGPLVDDLEEAMRVVRLRIDSAEGTKRVLLPIVAVYRRDDGADNHYETARENSPFSDL